RRKVVYKKDWDHRSISSFYSVKVSELYSIRCKNKQSITYMARDEIIEVEPLYAFG
ncbi:MAG: hypothetical protein ACI9FJ_000429, partial [Alteromonadaceae bacterium]